MLDPQFLLDKFKDRFHRNERSHQVAFTAERGNSQKSYRSTLLGEYPAAARAFHRPVDMLLLCPGVALGRRRYFDLYRIQEYVETLGHALQADDADVVVKARLQGQRRRDAWTRSRKS